MRINQETLKSVLPNTDELLGMFPQGQRIQQLLEDVPDLAQRMASDSRWGVDLALAAGKVAVKKLGPMVVISALWGAGSGLIGLYKDKTLAPGEKLKSVVPALINGLISPSSGVALTLMSTFGGGRKIMDFWTNDLVSGNFAEAFLRERYGAPAAGTDAGAASDVAAANPGVSNPEGMSEQGQPVAASEHVQAMAADGTTAGNGAAAAEPRMISAHPDGEPSPYASGPEGAGTFRSLRAETAERAKQQPEVAQVATEMIKPLEEAAEELKSKNPGKAAALQKIIEDMRATYGLNGRVIVTG